MTRQFFNQQFAAMVAAYAYAQKAPEVGQDVYWEVLKGMSEREFAHGVRSCLLGCKFFPTIAEIAEAAKSVPPARLKLLDEPRLSPAEMERGQELLRRTVKELTAKMDVRKAHEKA